MKANRPTATLLGIAVLVCGSLTVGNADVVARSTSGVDPVKLTGCVVNSEDNDGFLLINTPREPAAVADQSRAASPTTLGTVPVYANIFYWLDKDDDLVAHVGHVVEVEGELKGELRDGQIKIDRKERWTEIEVESDGRDMKARVPNTSIVAGPDTERKISVLVRRVDVDKVRMIEATCR